MFRPLPKKFYEPSAQGVAPALLGHWLVRRLARGHCAGLIVETEAYLASDPACHAYGGETRRNRVMWGEPGHAYVYLIYGFHHCFNTVCCPPGQAEAVLVRAIEPVRGLAFMRSTRPVLDEIQLTNGPGKLCAALGIDRKLDGAFLCDARSSVFIAENPGRAEFLQKRGPMIVTARIGITRGADLPLRFCLPQSPFVSRRPPRDLEAPAPQPGPLPKSLPARRRPDRP